MILFALVKIRCIKICDLRMHCSLLLSSDVLGLIAASVERLNHFSVNEYSSHLSCQHNSGWISWICEKLLIGRRRMGINQFKLYEMTDIDCFIVRRWIVQSLPTHRMSFTYHLGDLWWNAKFLGGSIRKRLKFIWRCAWIPLQPVQDAGWLLLDNQRMCHPPNLLAALTTEGWTGSRLKHNYGAIVHAC